MPWRHQRTARASSCSYMGKVRIWSAPCFQRRALVFTTALHPRLGAGCLARELEPAIVRLIGEQCAHLFSILGQTTALDGAGRLSLAWGHARCPARPPAAGAAPPAGALSPRNEGARVRHLRAHLLQQPLLRLREPPQLRLARARKRRGCLELLASSAFKTCPVSTEGGTRRVQLVREGGGGGGRSWYPASIAATCSSALASCASSAARRASPSSSACRTAASCGALACECCVSVRVIVCGVC
jgi:hypothetical protein